ncbi:unnamed protein product [Lasius platythorax]|uniref:Uncharacterized protein n=1 Tax=Lasius platythorax TaxID=488582 RepID=A0AAV2P4W4_9HYME
MSMTLKILAVNLTKLFYRDKIYKTYSLNENGDPFRALVGERSFHYSDQFAILEFEAVYFFSTSSSLTTFVATDGLEATFCLLSKDGFKIRPPESHANRDAL